MSNKSSFFTEDETDALQELMNIAFGKAAAELAEIIDISVVLSFPKLETVKIQELPDFISGDLSINTKCNIVEQTYKGEAGGVAFLIFPFGSESDFLSLFHLDEEDELELFADADREILAEVGNILIGACVSKLFDLLKSPVIYTPPHAIIGQEFGDKFFKGRFSGDDCAIILKTSFFLSEKSVEGFLFLVNNQSSVGPIKHALAKLFESYE
ncbi:MAG: chemotaxis protein CheC [Denitrovibrio sp.]|nr:MAG: chemotaxis protein CheC [Denitrovibrio sp.]